MLANQQIPSTALNTGSDPASGRDEASAGGALSLWLYAAFCALSIVPFIAVAHPPIVDFPNHAARLGLQCAMADPNVSAMYAFKLGLIPNLAIDLINVPLCGAIGPLLLLKATIVASLVVLYSSCWQIQTELFGRANPLLLFVPAMSLNLVTTMGYLNYFVGVAICSAIVALALRRRGRSRELVLIGNIGGLLLFFAHIFALALTTVFFFGWFLKRPFRPRNLIRAGLRTAAMFAVPLLLIPFVPSEGADLSISYAGKPRALFAPFLMHSGEQAALILVVIIVPLYLLWRHGRVSLHPLMRLPLLMLGIYVMLLPGQLQEAVDIDGRTFVALAYLLFASLAPSKHVARTSRLVTVLAVLPLSAHLFTAATVWQPFSGQVTEFRSALKVLPLHSAVLSVRRVATGAEPLKSVAPVLAYSHLASYATADRRVFNPLEFTGIGMQPLSSKDPFAAIDVPASMPIPVRLAMLLKSPVSLQDDPALAEDLSYARQWPKTFDYVVYYHFGGAPNFDPETLRMIEQGSFFSILAINRPRS